MVDCYLAECGFFGGGEENSPQFVLVAAEDAIAVENGAVVEILAAHKRQHRQHGAKNFSEIVQQQQPKRNHNFESAF